MATVIDIDKLKSFTQELMNHVHIVEHEFGVKPKREHILTAINFNSIKERREDFINALINTVTSWVYSKAKRDKLFAEKMVETKDLAAASAFLTNLAQRKFRPGHPQGQFGELLLFNFLQHFFHAVPMLRKQRITTNVGMERHGADAIHYSNNDSKNHFLLGESKCYESKYQFANAFEESLKSIIKTFENYDKELDQYAFEDFIEDELLSIAQGYKAGTLKDVNFQFVCIIIYNETNDRGTKDEAEIKKNILGIVKDRCDKFPDDKFEHIKDIVDRIHYIFFPIWTLDELLEDFSNKVGISK